MARWAAAACALVCIFCPSVRGDESQTPQRSSIQLIVPEESEDRAKIEHALDEKTTIDFTDAPLWQIVGYLADRHHIDIQIAKGPLKSIGSTAETPMTCHLDDVSLRFALRWLLRPRDMDYVVLNAALRVTRRLEADEVLSIKTYPVRDLLEAGPIRWSAPTFNR